MARRSEQLAMAIAELAQRLRRHIIRATGRQADGERLRSLHVAYCRATGSAWGIDEFADSYVQALACGAAVVRFAAPEIGETGAADWLLAAASPLCREVLRDCFSLALGWPGGEPALAEVWDAVQRPRGREAGGAGRGLAAEDSQPDPIIHFYELFLKQCDAGKRARNGVFYTPEAVVRFIVGSVDELLRSEFELPDGLADLTTWGEMVRRHPSLAIPAAAGPGAPFVHVLDPAMGTGAFLVEVIDLVYRELSGRWSAAGCTAEAVRRRWSCYVPRHLLARISGLELMLPACVIAHLRVAVKLAETGYDFAAGGRLSLFVADTLAPPALPLQAAAAACEAPTAAMDGAESVRCEAPCTVILGNPPFSAVSNNRNPWIVDLLKGRLPGPAAAANYYEACGQPLDERKLWLQDDYVKFIRFAQWRIESATCGLIGFVTNHGYLDNSTFRGMRQQLMSAFPHITVVDLHGNRKKRELAPDGRRDENVFETEQGVAVGLFRRPIEKPQAGVILYGELWGRRGEKRERLRAATAPHCLDGSICSPAAPGSWPAAPAAGPPTPTLARRPLDLTCLRPQAPHFFFTPLDSAVREEYERGWKLTDIMPVHTTAPVTARDSFVVAFEEEELLERMGLFRDLRVPHAEVRRRFFTNGRSAKYPPGDTRGWKLPEARRHMAADPCWRRAARTCLYRPFDRRSIYWADWMIDWPREEVTRHLLDGRNLALIARRQMPPSQPCTYFWICDEIALDGVIRSDNRGSESLFPLYVNVSRQVGELDSSANVEQTVNLAPAFVDRLRQSVSLQFMPVGCGDLHCSFGPDDVAHYLYAMFHSPTYRRRYADWLRVDFPRVFLPRSQTLFHAMCRIGARLAALHLLRGDACSDDAKAAPTSAAAGQLVAPGYPKYADGRVYVNQTAYFKSATRDAWDYHVGGYQVLRKWLKDRQRRVLTAAEANCYQHIVAAAVETQTRMIEIDQAIEGHGGWPGAFPTA